MQSSPEAFRMKAHLPELPTAPREKHSRDRAPRSGDFWGLRSSPTVPLACVGKAEMVEISEDNSFYRVESLSTAAWQLSHGRDGGDAVADALSG